MNVVSDQSDNDRKNERERHADRGDVEPARPIHVRRWVHDDSLSEWKRRLANGGTPGKPRWIIESRGADPCNRYHEINPLFFEDKFFAVSFEYFRSRVLA